MNRSFLNQAFGAVFVFLAILTPENAALAQGSKADYERAMSLRQKFNNKVIKSEIEPHWFVDNRWFWYRNDLAEGRREFLTVNARNGKKRAAFNHARLAQKLHDAMDKDFDPERLPFRSVHFENGRGIVRFIVDDKNWSWNRKTRELRQTSDRPPIPESRRQKRGSGRSRGKSNAPKEQASPDKKWTAFFRENNLWLRQKEGGKELQLSSEGNEEDAYSGRAHWSPNSSKLVVLRTRRAQEHTIHHIETAPKGQLQPKLHSMNYLKPGDRIAHPRPRLFDIASQKSIEIDDTLFPNPWRISDLRWAPDSSEFTFLYNQRGHQILRIVGVNTKTAKTRAVVDEQSKTFIDYAYKKFTHYLAETKEIVWMSERDGWNHLYLYDAAKGQVKNQITRGKWVVRGVDHVDPETRQIWFRASGIYPAQDPYYIHYCRIHFDGTGLVKLTEANGTHATKWSPDRKHLVTTWSRVDQPAVHELRRASDGSLVAQVERADEAALRFANWRAPERFTAKARDGKTDIHGVIIRPTNFDPKKRYPVIESIYAGPHGSFVPKSFHPYFKMMQMAELGFIVVKMDGMGTSNRSKEFHDVCWKNLGDSGFPDRILWIKAAAKKYPHMDLTRVGIYGGSAGGQSSTRAMLAHGDFYQAAVSDCGCHDNRMDKIWWNELWMSWPIGPHYAEQSNVTQARNLTGKLMLVVGELDRNVDPASTMQVVDALIKADKDFDLLVVPGGGHGIAEQPYGNRRRMDFFVRHLIGKEPRWE